MTSIMNTMNRMRIMTLFSDHDCDHDYDHDNETNLHIMRLKLTLPPHLLLPQRRPRRESS